MANWSEKPAYQDEPERQRELDREEWERLLEEWERQDEEAPRYSEESGFPE